MTTIVIPLPTNDGFLELLPVDGSEPARACPNCQAGAVAFLIHQQLLTPFPETRVGCLQCA